MPLQILASDPYTGQLQTGITVTFSDGGMGGTFSPSSAATNASGIVTTTYTFPRKSGAYTLTASAPNSGSVTATERANALPPTRLASSLGARQTGAAGSTLPNPIVVTALEHLQEPSAGCRCYFVGEWRRRRNSTVGTHRRRRTSNRESPVANNSGYGQHYGQIREFERDVPRVLRRGTACVNRY